ncbi:hypothetical protein ACHAWX_001192 [Stephanocyclus meneghinianus]
MLDALSFVLESKELCRFGGCACRCDSYEWGLWNQSGWDECLIVNVEKLQSRCGCCECGQWVLRGCLGVEVFEIKAEVEWREVKGDRVGGCREKKMMPLVPAKSLKLSRSITPHALMTR